MALVRASQIGLVFALMLGSLWPIRAAMGDQAAAWAALRQGGHVALMRHATAPGVGDPPGLSLDDCSTQRNLSDGGRAEARLGGARLKAEGIRADAIYSSQWCRCLETARLIDLGPVTTLPLLNSFFDRPHDRDAQIAALRPWVASARPRHTLFLVTHQVVIAALTGVSPASGEIVVVRGGDNGRLTVVGRVSLP